MSMSVVLLSVVHPSLSLSSSRSSTTHTLQSLLSSGPSPCHHSPPPPLSLSPRCRPRLSPLARCGFRRAFPPPSADGLQPVIVSEVEVVPSAALAPAACCRRCGSFPIAISLRPSRSAQFVTTKSSRFRSGRAPSGVRVILIVHRATRPARPVLHRPTPHHPIALQLTTTP